MERAQFDVVVVGGGPGGYVAAIRAAQLGLRTALVERDKVGGVCLHWGCIPTKAMLEAAELVHRASLAAGFGIHLGEPRIDPGQLFARRDQVVEQLYRGLETLIRGYGITLVRGTGRLSGPTTVLVSQDGSQQELAGRAVIVATGSRPKMLPGWQPDPERILTSNEALARRSIPRSVIIIGAGAVGVEFASIWRDLGSEVTLVEALPRLVPLEDPEVSEALARAYARRGIAIRTGARVLPETLQQGPDGVAVEITVENRTERLTAECILVAIGRAANIENLGLEGLRVRIERGAIQVNEYQQTAEPNLYAIGDVTGRLPLAHVASAEGIVAAEAIAGQEPIPIDYLRAPRATYCRPQIASMGLTEEEARAKGYEVKVGRFPFRPNSRALILGEAEGFVKIVSDAKTGEILGAHLIGPHVTELLPELTLARFLEATPDEIATNIHAHPTLSEALAEAAHAVFGQPIHLPPRTPAGR